MGMPSSNDAGRESVPEPSRRPSSFLRYGAALVLVALAIMIQAYLASRLDVDLPPFLFSVPAILVVVWFFGRGAGLAATAMAVAGVWYFIFRPTQTFLPLHLSDALVLGVFVLTALAIDFLLPALQDRFAKANAVAGALRDSEAAQKIIEQQLRLFIEHAPAAIAMFDTQMRYLAVSRRWGVAYGVNSAELIGKSHYEVFSDIPERWKEIHRRCLAGIVERREEDPWPRADGRTDWVRWEIRPWYTNERKVGGLIIFSENITSIKQTERKLQEAVALRDEFLSIASHELKTPLTALALQIELTLRELKRMAGHDLEKERSLLGTVMNSSRQIRRLATLINDLLDVSRIQSGRLSLSPEPVRVGELLAEVVEKMTPTLLSAGCRLKTKLPSGDHDQEAFWDRVRIEQVLTNLLSNAAKYAPCADVSVEATIEGGRATVVVTDSGPGIEKEHQNQIFERFERVSSTKAISGLGLGLYIVRQIAEAHGGSVHVRSEPGQGASFVVELPLHAEARVRVPA